MTVQIDHGRLDIERIRQQIDKDRLDIDRIRKDMERTSQELRYEPWKALILGLGAFAAAVGAGVGIAT